ncbi:DUF488 domain-containing protein [Paenibacillus apiarius]|uniref:DUF488 family protein n=1 Tax=Paenibacillus apiarius TaxID=46240 RepID=A0ABT4E2I5_9BACL|nr:DUF488 family protein [Paenibacillus apiarius]MCY9517062.1 DUF488 family protein [Paenibacillus apiarius]MCY9523230.1 DUF488 family protein [Paenibacillus apiarius]MCY9554272.1 DUF488 family protein [Paenibacillus apiarius]MCY9560883.1 DUF488 family protein [Paenibacillus apiarius]MCY9682804.1 DUF488 family protein [Paenibacillus apiarius]
MDSSYSDITVLRSNIRLKRIYEPPVPEDGYRILIDRIWPRGVSKQQAAIDEWMKEIAPSPELRKWFGHQPARFEAFSESYVREIEEDSNRSTLANRICEISLDRSVTLVYAAKDSVHNHANVLHRWLISR